MAAGDGDRPCAADLLLGAAVVLVLAVGAVLVWAWVR